MDERTTCFKDEYWMPRGNRFLLTYIGPPLTREMDIPGLRMFLIKNRALVALWNYDFDYTNEGPWYRCICDTPGYSVENIASRNVRHNLARSLKRCETRRVSYDWLADNGYGVYCAASARYTNHALMSEKVYQASLRAYTHCENRIAYGVFVEEKLAAYATLFVCGSTVFGDTAHFDSAFANAYPMYALYYTIASSFINTGYVEFDRGTKPLVHETNIDEFLVRLGFRLSYCRLGFYMLPAFAWALSPLTILLRRCNRMIPEGKMTGIKALVAAKDIAEKTSPVKMQANTDSSAP